MKKYILTVILSLFSLFNFSQELVQLTSLENAENICKSSEFRWINDKFIHIFENVEDGLDAWEFDGVSYQKIYETSVNLCEVGIYDWLIWEENIIYTNSSGFWIENILTGEIKYEVKFEDFPDLFYDFEIIDYWVEKKGNILILYNHQGDGFNIYFDLNNHEFISEPPKYYYSYIYKTAKYNYFTENNILFRHIKDDKDLIDTIAHLYQSYYKEIDNKLIVRGLPKGNLIVIDKVDSISVYPNFYKDNISMGREDEKEILMDIDDNLVIVEKATFEKIDSFPSDNFSVFGYYNKKAFIHLQPLHDLMCIDFEKDTIVDFHINFWNSDGADIDSLLFLVDLGYDNLLVINKKTTEIKEMKFDPFIMDGLEYDKLEIFKFKDNYIFFRNDKCIFYKYDYITNTLEEFLTDENLKYGVGDNLNKIGNVVYMDNFTNFYHKIMIYDKNDTQGRGDNVFIHNIHSPLKSKMMRNDKGFYYFIEHDFNGSQPSSDSFYYDLIYLNPFTFNNDTLMNGYSYKYDRFSASFLDNYIIFDYSGGDVFNVKTNKLQKISNLEHYIFDGICAISDEYYYSIYETNKQKILYCINKDDLSKFIPIHPIESNSLPSFDNISGNIISFISEDSLFYYDGSGLNGYYLYENSDFKYIKKLNSGEIIVYKDYNNNCLLIFNTVEKKIKIIQPNNSGDIVETYYLTMYDNKLLYTLDSPIKKLVSYDLITGEYLDVELPPEIEYAHFDLIYVDDDNYHFLIYNSIYIISKDFRIKYIIDQQEIENSLYRFVSCLNPPSAEKQICIYFGNPSIAPIPLKILEYNHVTLQFEYLNSTCVNDLKYSDFTVIDSTIYILASNIENGYQLYSFTFDAKYINSKNEEVGKNALVYPNPTTGILYFERMYEKATIYDLNGKQVSSCDLKSNSINIDFLKNGVYLLELKAKNRCDIQKIVKIE